MHIKAHTVWSRVLFVERFHVCELPKKLSLSDAFELIKRAEKNCSRKSGLSHKERNEHDENMF